ncbi:purine-cytosine permease family protein [Streptomyces sp. NPDC058045]|uniref:purine-cytosine permease family protein n=1 Tax=Streptomyces sp. NPDC058045 TaxID=3346311 RepID=UPI0036EB5DE8
MTHTPAAEAGSTLQVESRSYEFVPLEERHGKTRNLFSLWFGEQLSSFALVTGALAVSLGLNFWWAIAAIVLGNLIGATMMAGHSAQGPALGLPQMIQSRAQFGFYGTLLPLVITWVMYVAFSAVAVVIAGQGFQSVFGGSLALWIAVSVVPILVLAIVGYDMIHSSIKYIGWVMGVLFIVVAVLLFRHGVSMDQLGHGGFSWSSFLGATSLFVTWQLTYAPYVSDYSRYLPPHETKGAFWYTYVGTVGGSVVVMVLGAAVATLAPTADVVQTVRNLGGGTGGGIIVVMLAIGLIIVNSTNIYGGTISTLTLLQHFKDIRSTVPKRVAAALLIGGLAVLAGIAGSADFVDNLINYLNFVLYFMIPWTTVNLVDFYVIHHGSYRTEDFFSKNGTFGRWGMPAIATYLITFVIEVPFINTTVFEGPLARAMGGVDLAWLVGPVVSIPLYLVLAKRKLRIRHLSMPSAAELLDGEPAEGLRTGGKEAESSR